MDITPIINQLEDYCECVQIDKMKKEETLEKNVQELLFLVSTLLCWTQNPCETFLNSERVEVIDIDDFDLCDCCGGVYDFDPFYHPFEQDSFKFELIALEGIKETITEIKSEDYIYSQSFDLWRVNLRNYIDCNNCGCPTEYKLRITYMAGFDALPECLLRLFCDLLHTIYYKNNCKCPTCQACTDTDTEAEVVFDSNDSISQLIVNYTNSVIYNAYRNQLGLLSLCSSDSDLWGIVV